MQFKGTGRLLVKDLDHKQGIVQAYWAAFGNIDDDKDIIEPGAFGKTIAERGPQSKQPRIKFLYQHHKDMVIGAPSELVQDSNGLLATTRIPPTSLGQDVLLLYEYGALDEHSIGYEDVVAMWDRIAAARRLKELSLWEGSVVTWGANQATPVVALKSLSDPARVTALATKAAKLDNLLHNGALRSDALCATLERELKALQTALAPAHADSQPYDIGRLVDDMGDLAARLSTKAASDDDKKAQAARAKRYGIGIKDGGNVTKPSAWKDVPDAEWGDPVNYKLPMPDKEHADNAASRFAQDATRSQYSKAEQGIIDKRIAKRQADFGETDDAKGAAMHRSIKGSGGSVEVADDGTHASYTGTHTHSHKAMGAQGDDDQHEHKHEHKGDASHDHPHDAAPPSETSSAKVTAAPKSRNGHPVRKARDFGTLFASLNESSQLQDDWGDTFIAFVQAMWELMGQSQAQQGGWMPEGAEMVDIEAAAQENVDAFGAAVMTLVTRSIAADFVPAITCDRDQFIDPDGPNAEDDDDYKSRHAPQRMPDAPALLAKAGRAISAGNRKVITDALDGMSEAMKAMKGHHGAIADLMTKTDPDAVRQDEDDTQGDDDSENGGTNINKGRHTHPAPDRRQAGTTHQGSDTTAIFADLDDVVSRLKLAGKVK